MEHKCYTGEQILKALSEVGVGAGDISEVLSYLSGLPSAETDLDEHSAWFRIGETLVDESKAHISAQEAC